MGAAPQTMPADGFVWIDCLHAEVTADPDALRAAVECLTRVRLFDLHLQDAINLQHPSSFDSTQHYDVLVFRKLAPGEAAPLAERPDADMHHPLQEIVTRPITFLVFDRLLVSVRNEHSKTVEQMYARLLGERGRNGDGSESGDGVGPLPDKLRLPLRPDDLMLRLLNGMVDRYLELRQPLTDRLDRWQRELLDPRRPFADWSALLDARIEIRRLQNLCEEQYDALQELRDSYLENTPQPHQSDHLLVRIADVIEHVKRVLTHTQRLEVSIESAVQLHFSATSHRTNQVVRSLTVITAIFAPLTLISGLWGMNFDRIPLARHPHGFAIIVSAMLTLAVLLLVFFWAKRYWSDRPSRLKRRMRWTVAATSRRLHLPRRP